MSSQLARQTQFPTVAAYDLSDRYADDWLDNFAAQYETFLQDSMTILDVGSGRSPVIPVDRRPKNSRYIGLDISGSELMQAPAGSYDEQYQRDLKVHDPTLDGQIDLAVSWQVLEHIEPLSEAIDNLHAYLKPGGHFVGLLSGRNAHFALINRIIPERIGKPAMKYLLQRPPDSVFRAHYDKCTYTGLRELFDAWRKVEVAALFRGAGYLSFLRPAASLYLKYEDWAARSRKRNLATHYVIVAEK